MPRDRPGTAESQQSHSSRHEQIRPGASAPQNAEGSQSHRDVAERVVARADPDRSHVRIACAVAIQYERHRHVDGERQNGHDTHGHRLGDTALQKRPCGPRQDQHAESGHARRLDERSPGAPTGKACGAGRAPCRSDAGGRSGGCRSRPGRPGRASRKRSSAGARARCERKPASGPSLAVWIGFHSSCGSYLGFAGFEFADFELAAHVRVEGDEPVTAELLNDLYKERFDAYYGDSVDLEALTPITWARIPHFFNTPYYVYQYATCFASAAKLARQISEGSPEDRAEARHRYLELLAAGGSDHPMALLNRAGVDLSEPSTIQAVVDQLGSLVDRLEELI